MAQAKFHKFISINIKELEALEMEKELTHKGTYSIFKAVMFIEAAATLLFISFAEKALLDNIIAILAGLTALISLL